MAPKKSSKRSESTRNGAASMRLKKLTGRRSESSKATIRRLAREVKSLKKMLRKVQYTVNSLAGFESNSRSSLSQSESSMERRRLQLHFVYELSDEQFTANIINVTGTEPKGPVTVRLLDENNIIVNEGQLSSLKLQVFVVEGGFKVKESEDWTGAELEASSVSAREEKGLLLVGSCVRTMDNGVCCFDDLKFVDNSSWVSSKMFRLVVKVAENVQLPDMMVQIRPAVSGPFRVKDQRVEPNKKHPIPSYNDGVQRLKKIGKESYARLKAAGILTVQDFLRKYYKDQSSLREILGVKNGVWETIVEHATKCSMNGEHFLYDSAGAVLFFDCFYKVIGVSFDHHTHRPLDTLLEHEKRHVEQLRQCALEDESKLVHITNFPGGWMAPHSNPQNPPAPAHQGIMSCQNCSLTVDQPVQVEEVLLRCLSFPQTPLLDSGSSYTQPEGECAAQNSEILGYGSLLRSDSLLWDSIVINQGSHPLSTLDLDEILHGQASSCEPVDSVTGRVWLRGRVAVFKLVWALRLTNIRRLASRS